MNQGTDSSVVAEFGESANKRLVKERKREKRKKSNQLRAKWRGEEKERLSSN